MTALVNYSEIDMLARELSQYTGETTAQATIVALRERLARELARRQRAASIKQELLRIGRECAALPVLDPRQADEILGYDEVGLPQSW
jgi:antitoxin VapB